MELVSLMNSLIMLTKHPGFCLRVNGFCNDVDSQFLMG
jgi:hypothetical protein